MPKRKQPENTDNRQVPTKVMLTMGEWKKLLKLVDNKQVKVAHPEEYQSYQILQEKILSIANGPGLFADEEAK